jgi:hypothetical protein
MYEHTWWEWSDIFISIGLDSIWFELIWFEYLNWNDRTEKIFDLHQWNLQHQQFCSKGN